MSALPVYASRLFRARTAHIVSLSKLDVTLDLDFGVSVRKTVEIDGLRSITLPTREDWERARHCMTVLLGGKRLAVQPDPSTREEWYRLPVIVARVYLAERVVGSPIGFVSALPELGCPALEVGPFVHWLSQQGFDVDLVREAINGGG